jgi:hypothetical protein
VRQGATTGFSSAAGFKELLSGAFDMCFSCNDFKIRHKFIPNKLPQHKTVSFANFTTLAGTD